jgi:SAM-dependent methyltransferase
MDPALYEQHYRLEDTHWWFLGRRRLVLNELTRYAGTRAGRILDLGCGTGGMLPHLTTLGDALGLDSADEAALACRRRGVPFVKGWGSQLPFRDAAFDAVTALDVIEHVPDDAGLLREIRRVLRPGGLLLVTVPAYQFLWSQHDVFNHHQRRYRRSQLGRLLRRTGYEIAKLTYYNTLLFPAAMLRKATMRVGRNGSAPPASHLDEVPEPLNTLLRWIMVGEQPLVEHLTMPFGASIIAVARRPVASTAAQTGVPRVEAMRR